MHGAALDNEAAFLHRHAKAFVRCRFLSVARTIGIEEDTDRIGRELLRKAAFYLIAFAADRDAVRKAGGFL